MQDSQLRFPYEPECRRLKPLTRYSHQSGPCTPQYDEHRCRACAHIDISGLRHEDSKVAGLSLITSTRFASDKRKTFRPATATALRRHSPLPEQARLNLRNSNFPEPRGLSGDLKIGFQEAWDLNQS